MARTPGLSVRLKLTLSYVGFLMLTAALPAAAAWVFFLRYIPAQERIVPGPAARSRPPFFPSAPVSTTLSPPRRPSWWPSCWYSAS